MAVQNSGARNGKSLITVTLDRLKNEGHMNVVPRSTMNTNGETEN